MAKLTNCPTCKAEIASTAIVCPSCGAKIKKPIFKKWWFWAIVIIIIAAIGSQGGNTGTGGNEQVSGGTSNNSSSGSNAIATSKVPDFEIVGDLTTENDAFAVYILGTVKNNKGKDLSYVQITFNLYDKDGNQVGTALANINNLEKDGTWKFKAMGMGVNGEIASYKLVEITGF